MKKEEGLGEDRVGPRYVRFALKILKEIFKIFDIFKRENFETYKFQKISRKRGEPSGKEGLLTEEE